MQLWELETGMIVRTRQKEDSLHLVLRDTEFGDCLFGDGGYLKFDYYNEDLTAKQNSYSCSFDEFDIIEVYKPKWPGSITHALAVKKLECMDLKDWECIWKYEEPPVEMTVEQIEQILGVKNLKIVGKK